MVGKIFVLLTFSGLAFGGPYTSVGLESSHYEQHSQSVEAGRKKLHDQLGTSTPSSYDHCTSCVGYANNLGLHGNLDLGLGIGGVSNSLSASHYTNTQQRAPVSVILPVSKSDGSESYRRSYEKRIHSESTPIILTSSNGGSENYERHYDKHAQSQASPIIAAPTTSVSKNYQSHYEKRIESQTAPIMFSPSSGSENYETTRSEKVDQSHFPVIYTPSGGSSSHSAYTHHEESKSIPTIRYVQPPLRNLENSEYLLRKNVQNTGSTIPVNVDSRGSSSLYMHGNVLSPSKAAPYPTYYPTGSFGLHVNNFLNDNSESRSWDKGYPSTSEGLLNYMSESERLARVQAQNVNPGETPSRSSILGSKPNLDLGKAHFDATFDGRSGYRTQSWEKSSKWESGTQYGPDGRPKSFNLLSTAESEHHNVNGKAAGFKAATTTLNDNGKVSTYSIHT